MTTGIFSSTGEGGLLSTSLTSASMNPSMRLRNSHSKVVGCEHLVQVDTHNGIRKVGKRAFIYCTSLRRINLKSAVEIDDCAFSGCYNLESVEFGDDLETIGRDAFWNCSSLKLKHLKLPSVITIGGATFYNCEHLKDIELSERLETIGERAFQDCESLHRIAIPLTRELFLYDDEWERYSQFEYCDQLVTVDLVGWIHKTVAPHYTWRVGGLTWKKKSIESIKFFQIHLTEKPKKYDNG